MYKIIFFLLISAITFAQNITDDLGHKQGKWSQNYDNGQLRYEGSFIDDKPSGIFLYYNERGLLKANLEYFNEGEYASARLYHSNNKVKAVGLYIHEQKEQLWKYYDTRENLIREENYKNGQLEGETTLFYVDGNVLDKTTYSVGKKEGKSLQYYRNGQLKVSANYAANKLEGTYTLYNSEGVKKYQGKYSNDIKVGIWKYYKDDKSFDYQIEYIDGISQGRQDG